MNWYLSLLCSETRVNEPLSRNIPTTTIQRVTSLPATMVGMLVRTKVEIACSAARRLRTYPNDVALVMYGMTSGTMKRSMIPIAMPLKSRIVTEMTVRYAMWRDCAPDFSAMG